MAAYTWWILWIQLLQENFGVRHIGKNMEELNSALYLQVSIISQALIFVTRSRSWSFIERPGLLLLAAFIAAQLVGIFILFFTLNWFLPLSCAWFPYLILTLVPVKNRWPPSLLCMHTGASPGSMALGGDGQEWSGSTASLPTFLSTSSSSPFGMH